MIQTTAQLHREEQLEALRRDFDAQFWREIVPKWQELGGMANSEIQRLYKCCWLTTKAVWERTQMRPTDA